MRRPRLHFAPGIIDTPPGPALEVCRRVKIHEADAKSLLVAQGLPVPPWTVAHSAAEARTAAQTYLLSPQANG